MKKITVAVLIALIICSFPGCRSRQEFEFVPLKEYQYEQADIQPGTEVKLIAFSGGKSDDEKNAYYYQFIVRNKTTGDTVRILAPLISFDETSGSANKIYTTPLQYSLEKGITDASFQLKDSSHNLLLNTERLEELAKSDNMDSSIAFGTLTNEINKNELVVVNRSISLFKDARFKTAIGILHFKEMTW